MVSKVMKGDLYVRFGGSLQGGGCGGGGQLEKLVADSRVWGDPGRGNDKHKCPGAWPHPACSLSPCNDHRPLPQSP